MEEELLAICKPVLAKQRSDRSHIPPSVELRYLNLAWENYPCERRASFACEALWERLHLDKWSEVADDVREQYAVAGSLKAAAFLRNNERTPQLLKSVLDVLDHVLLMGPGNNVAVARIAAKVHSLLPAPEQQGDMEVVSKAVELQEEVDRVVRPSLSWFRKHALKAAKPWVLVRCLDDWPALEKWKDVKYLLRIAGHRLVPVELGNDYMDESWTQELMSFERFVNGFMLDGGKVSGKKRKEDERECGCRRDNPTRGYMAQHELLNQVQELQADIAIPDYCSLYVDEASDGGEVAVNVWLGPKGTASRMHFDPKNNLLAQVFGVKKVKLAAPNDSPYLYPYKGMMNNTSQVDFDKPLREQHFPLVTKATLLDVTLQPGEMLFIPQGYWHFVKATSASMSLSFWW